MKDLRIEVRAKNNLLYKLREQAGLSQPKFAELIGISFAIYSRMENLTYNPKSSIDGSWLKPALKISKYFRMLPEDLFPKWVENIRTNKLVKEIEFDEMILEQNGFIPKELPTMDDFCDAQDLSHIIRDNLSLLNEREEKVIRMRFGIGEIEHTLLEVADKFRVGPERIRQIEARALRRLRHPSKSNKMRDYIDIDCDTEKLSRGY